ncbi:L,D-transpeptidase family protein [Algoriphagus limi]|uniref:L,D-transpeptidase family protein n=1 Tax=Algoriphagus limi TaxID=2975273 RepID=A0ABT2G3G1_9BACT|nr:L,D-transpeptidase family protein [Algoriphagus limi]MCS5489780.1 L,D-transpeptidase family protein [Algoriphagus limi]
MKPLLFFIFLFFYQFSFSQDLSELLKSRLENTGGKSVLELRGREIQNHNSILEFYGSRNFESLWIDSNELSELAYELRYEIEQSKFDGLNPQDYHFALIQTFFKAIEENKKAGFEPFLEDLADIELFLSDAVIRLAQDLDQGKLDPSKLNQSWNIPKKAANFNSPVFFQKLAKDRALRPLLIDLYPKMNAYSKGREVIRDLVSRMEEDELDWSNLRTNKSIKVGESDGAIPSIRERLAFWNYLDVGDFESKTYDSLLFNTIIRFQEDNGLEADGIIGKNTLAALNHSPEDLIGKISVNLERLRWLEDSQLSSEAIMVNIPDFSLVYLNRFDTVFFSKVIVGKTDNQTPVFRATMSYIVFSPYWNVPTSIVNKEIIPAVRKNSNYLARNNMEVLSYSGQAIDPQLVNWKGRSIPYLIRQKPGPSNSLGLVKFMFPNSFSVYIHDTPAKHLFDRDTRSMSHGCIRLAKPFDFAKLLLQDQEKWTDEKIKESMNQDHEVKVELTEKIPVYVVYLTFWTDGKGNPYFRPDLYYRDQEILDRLRK